MKYITLEPGSFVDEEGKPSIELLALYCDTTINKFRYSAEIPATNREDLIFKNIVYANRVNTRNIGNQFPDLISAEYVRYAAMLKGKPDIGNLERVDTFIMILTPFNNKTYIKYIKKFINIINDRTLFINGKKLIINKFFSIGNINFEINSVNYNTIKNI